MPKVLGKAIAAADHVVAAGGERLEERPSVADRVDTGRDSSADLLLRRCTVGFYGRNGAADKDPTKILLRDGGLFCGAWRKPCPASNIRGGHGAGRPLAIAYPFELRLDYAMPSMRIKEVCLAMCLGTIDGGPRILLASIRWSD
jgi:hypothetical protein